MRIKNLLVASLCCFIFHCYSQEETPLNNPIYDNQSYHFGFTIGISNTKFQINYNDVFIAQNDFEQILSKYEPGFNVGIIIDFRLGYNINLRVTPSFNFLDQKIYFIKDNLETIEPKNTGISNFELPLYVKYRSDRINNGRVYILFGSSFILDLSNEDNSNQANLDFKRINYSADIGFGIDMYFAYFKLSPEIKYSHGLRNMLKYQNNNTSNQIKSLSTRAILVSLTFE